MCEKMLKCSKCGKIDWIATGSRQRLCDECFSKAIKEKAIKEMYASFYSNPSEARDLYGSCSEAWIRGLVSDSDYFFLKEK